MYHNDQWKSFKNVPMDTSGFEENGTQTHNIFIVTKKENLE